MKKKANNHKIACWALTWALMLAGCSGGQGKAAREPGRDGTLAEHGISAEQEASIGERGHGASPKDKEPGREGKQGVSPLDKEPGQEGSKGVSEDGDIVSQEPAAGPEMVDKDWSSYFEGLNGAAVVYNASDSQYMLYNRELALARRPPCSTFKIVSSLLGMEYGVIEPEDSVRAWGNEIFWNENWNKDIDFQEAFQESCVWYFREVIDEIGKERMQEGLDGLQYGNCDISDWEGRQNTNNNNRALTGFWLESSLLISPKEQTEVMERIFGDDAAYSQGTLEELRQVMLVQGQDGADISIYGKTGMGKTEGIVVDAWFTGFAESPEGKRYFCVYLGRTDNRDVSSTLAKEIAIRLMSDIY